MSKSQTFSQNQYLSMREQLEREYTQKINALDELYAVFSGQASPAPAGRRPHGGGISAFFRDWVASLPVGREFDTREVRRVVAEHFPGATGHSSVTGGAINTMLRNGDLMRVRLGSVGTSGDPGVYRKVREIKPSPYNADGTRKDLAKPPQSSVPPPNSGWGPPPAAPAVKPWA